MNDEIEEILKGSYDLHVHSGPSAGGERRLDALDTARQAYEAEMDGFTLKSHDYMTAPLAYALNLMYPGLNVSGSIVLNCAVGGLNPDAVEVAAKLNAKVVWMPTIDAALTRQERGGGPGIRLTEDSGAIRSELIDILDIIGQNDLVLASGHASPSEAIALFREARNRGVRRMIATHPGEVSTEKELSEMISLGATIEYPFLWCMPSRGPIVGWSALRMSPGDLACILRKLGIENCVVTTDFGQWVNPPPAEGMRMAIAALLQAGLVPEQVSTLVKTTPLRLIGNTS